jgi:hypothetical protein
MSYVSRQLFGVEINNLSKLARTIGWSQRKISHTVNHRAKDHPFMVELGRLMVAHKIKDDPPYKCHREKPVPEGASVAVPIQIGKIIYPSIRRTCLQLGISRYMIIKALDTGDFSKLEAKQKERRV